MTPRDPADLTAAWLTEALTPATGGIQVRDFTVERVGADRGFSGICVRVHLEFSDGEPLFHSVIAKFPVADSADSTWARRRRGDPERLRAAYDHALQEIRFFTRLAPAGGIRVPRCLASGCDPDTFAVVLLLEDLAGFVAGDALAGCSGPQAEAVLREIGRLHAWGEPRVHELEKEGWLPRWWRDEPAAGAERYRRDVKKFLHKHGEKTPAGIVRLIEEFEPAAERIFARLQQGPFTLVHGDLHLDNVLFDPKTKAAVILDWPGVGIGRGAVETAQFIAGSLRTEVRREWEHRLLIAYGSAVATAGGRERSREALLGDYRLGLLRWFWMMVVWLGKVDPDPYTGRERAFVTQILDDSYFFDALLDHGGAALVEEFV